MSGKDLAAEERLLAEAAAILGLPQARVLFETGHRPSSKDRRRTDAALAELLAVVFLKEQGFAEIRLVPPSDKLTADIRAARGGRTYAFEVRRVTRGSAALAAGRAAVPPEKALARKFGAKIRQANATRKRDTLDASGVILVLDSGPGPAGLARAAYEGAGSPPGAHVCLLSAGGSGVWPPWD